MLKKISSYTFILIGLILLNSCKKEYESIQSIDDAKIADYIAKNNITNMVKDPSGYYYQITNEGTGDFYLNTDSVLYNWSIKSLFNGTTYYDFLATSNLGTLVGYSEHLQQGKDIPAIRTAITHLKPGGSARIILPSYLAFGKNGEDAINVPSNEVIDFNIITYPEKSQAELDDRKIREFLTAKGLTATKDESGVYYIVTEQGTGTDVIDISSSLTVNYTGRTLDDKVFDSSTDGTFNTTLTGVIQGWGVLKNFKKGAKVRLFVPSALAYGTGGQGSILPNSCLDFDIEILNVVN